MNLVKGRAERSWQVHAEAADEFRRKVRAELGIPGSLLPRGEWIQPFLPDEAGDDLARI
jgi:hypothetical protein